MSVICVVYGSSGTRDASVSDCLVRVGASRPNGLHRFRIGDDEILFEFLSTIRDMDALQGRTFDLVIFDETFYRYARDQSAIKTFLYCRLRRSGVTPHPPFSLPTPVLAPAAVPVPVPVLAPAPVAVPVPATEVALRVAPAQSGAPEPTSKWALKW